jgi:tetratricopeptide (TPR) repeat protein
LTKREFILLVTVSLSVIFIVALCSIIFTCKSSLSAPEEQTPIIEEYEPITEKYGIEEKEDISAETETSYLQTNISVSHQVQRPLSSLSGFNRIGGRVNVSELDPINFENPDLDILKQMGADQYLISFFAGEQFYREGNFDRAIAEYTTSINRNAEFIETYISRGNSWMKIREYNRAIEDYNRAIRLDSGRAELYNYRGFARAAIAAGNTTRGRNSASEWQLAIEDFSRAISINRNYVDALINRSHAFFQIGSYDRVIEDCDRIIRIEPANVIIWNRRGSAWYAKHDDDKAISDFTEAIKLNPNYALALYNRGNAWYSKGDPDRALADLNRCLAINPLFAAAYTSRGNIFRLLGNNESAAADFYTAQTITN